MNPAFKSKIRSLLFFSGLVFIIGILWSSRSVLSDQGAEISWTFLAGSIGLAVANNYLVGCFYFICLRKQTVAVDLIKALRMFIYGQAAKYVPGKFWIVLYQSTHLDDKNNLREITFANMNLALTNAMIIAVLSSGLVLLGTETSVCIKLMGALVLLPVVALTYRSLCFSDIASFLSGIVNVFDHGKESGTSSIFLPSSKHVLFLLVAFSFTYVSAYFLLISSMFEFDTSIILFYVGLLGVSWIAGMLTFILPGGIGVRELSFVFLAGLTSSEVSTEVLVALAAIVRIWLTIVEALAIAIMSLYDRCLD